jgi:hypothetical protein
MNRDLIRQLQERDKKSGCSDFVKRDIAEHPILEEEKPPLPQKQRLYCNTCCMETTHSVAWLARCDTCETVRSP